MTDVLGRQVDRLSEEVGVSARYFYELSIRHEDMHVEALAYTRQTLGYARAEGLGRPAILASGPGPAIPKCPAAAGSRFDAGRWFHLRQREMGARGRHCTIPNCQGAGDERRVRGFR